MLETLIASCPNSLDLTIAEHLELIDRLVEKLLKSFPDQELLLNYEDEVKNPDNESSIFLLLALKIAKSKLLVNKITTPLKVSVTFAMYKEHNRIKKSSEHPHGEDFLVRKVSQLSWLFKDNPNIDWELVVVDDGCPENSGVVANEIVKNNRLESRVKVLFLENAIRNEIIAVKPLTKTSESQKGGSIIFGMYDSMIRSTSDNHIVIFTDADLSTHLGQTGLLLDPLVSKNKMVAIGSRREEDSVVIKQGVRNDRGKLFIYLWKRLIPNLGEIIDTQCGFKAFRKEIVKEIIEDMIEKKFAFDIELLLKSELKMGNSIVKVPIAWIDSEAASTTTDIQPYLSMLKSISGMYRKYFTGNPSADSYANFIDSLSEEEFNTLLDNIPKEIVSKEPVEFNNYAGISANDLKNCI